MARDITEGDGNVWALADDGLPIARGIADIGVVSSSAIWRMRFEFQKRLLMVAKGDSARIGRRTKESRKGSI